jgi:CRISPR-associated protein Cas2
MARRRYLASYDIADDKRRGGVFNLLQGYGDHVQFSVFICELTPRERVELVAGLRVLIHHREDQVLILDMGDADSPPEKILESVGRAYEPPVRTLVV